MRCPSCGCCYYKVLGVDVTAVYYPPIYKNGTNINPDKNRKTTTCQCLKCGKIFKEIG